MPKVQNLIPTKRNTNITVLDRVFRIGPGGFIEDGDGNPLDVDDKYASRLLAAKREWSELNWDPNDPKNARRFQMPQKASAAALGRPPRTRDDMAVEYGAKPVGADEVAPVEVEKADKAGNIIDRKHLDASAPEGDALSKLAKADQKQEAESAERTPDTPDELAHGAAHGSSAPSLEDAATGLLGDDGSDAGGEETFTADDGTEYVIPSDGDWPEPDESMPRPYLQMMADAYEVDHKTRTPTKTLVKRINEAMFGPDEE